MTAQRPTTSSLCDPKTSSTIIRPVFGKCAQRTKVQAQSKQPKNPSQFERASVFLSSSTGRIASMKASVHHVFAGEIIEVQELKGIRVIPPAEEDAAPTIEYLVQWKDGSPDTWEPVANLADDLLRSYEQKWWGAVKKGDEKAVLDMMEGGAAVLARTVDENRRSALHFAAGLGRAPLCQALIQAGAEPNLADKEGYTALHMAAGYLHSPVINVLLAGGADPEQQDRQGRSPLELVESLRASLPVTDPSLVSRRLALEDVLKVLTDNLFEDVDPVAVLDSRLTEETQEQEYLVQFPGEEEPVWVAAKYVSDEVVEDFKGGLEYAEADCIVDVRNRGDSRTYKVRWLDGYPDSWEPEENVSPDLIAMYEGKKSGVSEEGAGAALTNGNGSVQATLQPVG